MNPFDQLSRRDFLDQTVKIGAAGLAASWMAASSAAATGDTAGSRWQIAWYPPIFA